MRLMLTSQLGGMDSQAELGEGNRSEYHNVSPGSYVAMMLVVKGTSSGGRPDVQMLRLTPPIEVDNGDVTGLQRQLNSSGKYTANSASTQKINLIGRS